MPTSCPSSPRGRSPRGSSRRLPRARALVARPLGSRQQLYDWVRLFTGLRVPGRSICPDHASPLDYLWRAYHEPAGDLVVWAPRGGGKTRLAALATLLDLLHKPGVSVRILGGSLEQSRRLWEHLVPDLGRLVGADIERLARSRGPVVLRNGSSAAALAQSQRAVRGLRVQKLRCDEVETFTPPVWEAAQLCTRSMPGAGHSPVAGCVEALSTFHSPYGLMDQVIERARRNRALVLKWCLLEVLARCPAERACDDCPLWEDCGGRAKTCCDGFVAIDDAIAMKQRVSRECWQAEVLCRKPSTRGCVFPSFDPAEHVRPDFPAPQAGPVEHWLAMDFGFANDFACLWIVRRSDGSVLVIDEHVQAERTLAEHLAVIQARGHAPAKRVACDPSGAQVNQQTAQSNLQLLRQAGFEVLTRSRPIVEGLERIRAALRPAAGPARLFVHPRCLRLIEALRCYRYPDRGGETPLKDNRQDHPIDALRYFFACRESAGEVAQRAY